MTSLFLAASTHHRITLIEDRYGPLWEPSPNDLRGGEIIYEKSS